MMTHQDISTLVWAASPLSSVTHCKHGHEKYDQMAAEQGHVCAMCGEPETETRNGKVLWLSVDHDHITGLVRALLCKRCNRVLGILKDSVVFLEKVIQYLKAHGKANL